MKKELTLEEKWEQAGLSNNFIFYKVLRNNPEVCKELIELLLGVKFSRIEMYQEETILTDPNSKGIRMDLYVQSSNECMDLELQAIDTKELPERARYYQSVMDVDHLKKGNTYREMKTSYGIFICMTDIFQKGLPVYTFENLCLQNTNIHLNDRTFKHFFIFENCGKLANVKQKSFFALLGNGKPNDSFTEKLSKLVEEAKHNTQWRMQFMEYERQRTYDREAGEAKAKLEDAVIAVREFNVSIELVAEKFGVPLDELKKALEK